MRILPPRGLLLFLVAWMAGAQAADAQISAELAAELDRLIVQVAGIPGDRGAERAEKLEQLGDLAVRANLLGAARVAVEEALALRQAGGGSDRDLGRLSLKLASIARRDQRLADADRHVQIGLARLRAAGPQSPEYIDALFDSLSATTTPTDSARAEATYREVRDLVLKLPPGSPTERRVTETMGDAAVLRNDLDSADHFYSRALAVSETSQRFDADYARVASALGAVAASRQQHPRAQNLYEAALKIYEGFEPAHAAASQVHDNLGLLHTAVGDLPAAVASFRRALTLRQQSGFGGDQDAATRVNLGRALLDQGRTAEAGAEFTIALELVRKHGATPELATVLGSVAHVEQLQGRLEAATAAATEALDLRRAQSPRSLIVAAAAAELATIREADQAFGEAAALHQEATSIRERLAPSSVELAQSLQRLAVTTSHAGDATVTANLFGRAVDAWARVAPGSSDHVDTLSAFGTHLLRRGNLTEGLRRVRDAIELLNRLAVAPAQDRLEARLQLSSRLQRLYGETIGVLADRGDAGEAFTMLDQMHERLRRAQCPECADATAPIGDPFDALRKAVGPGTVVVAFSVQPAATYAFVAARDTPVRGYRIDVTQASLTERIGRFTRRVRSTAASAAAGSLMAKEGLALHALLFGQFESAASQATQLLIVPDGPLEGLPFGALSRSDAPSRGQFLMEWKPMAFTPSVLAAAGWTGGVAMPISPSQLLPTTVNLGAASAGNPLAGGGLITLWPTDARATDELVSLFQKNLAQERSRAVALSSAQRTIRAQPRRAHPAYWAAFRYYGALVSP